MNINNTLCKNIEVFANTQCSLGEGCHWNIKRKSLFWVDILEKKLFEKKVGTAYKEIDLPFIATATFEHIDSSKIWLVTNRGVIEFNLCNENYRLVVPLFIDKNKFRTNDAGIDPYGNLVFSIMEHNPSGRNGTIYRVDKNKKTKKILSGVGIPNTFQWLINENKLYTCDSYLQEMYSFDYNENGIIEPSKKLFFSLKDSDFTPDGSTMSDNGLLWNAQWKGSCVAVYDLKGRKIFNIDLPIPYPTSCVFGGNDNKYLFITSACVSLDKSEIEKYPTSGAVFMIHTHSTGIKNNIISWGI